MRYFYHIVCFLFLFGCLSNIWGQRKTDERIIEEHMRFSSEKAFNTWSVSIGYGPLIMYSDLADYSLLPEKWKFGPSITLAKQIYPVWAFDLQFMMGDFFTSKGLVYNEGDLLDFSINNRTYINQLLALPGPINDKWDFYLKVGVGLTAFRSRVHYKETDAVVHYRDIWEANADDGYVVKGYDREDPYKKITRAKELVVPVGFGIEYRINRSFDIGFESSMRFSLEDKLDNVLVGSNNDRYWNSNINISYKIGRKNKRHSKWTYRNYGFTLLGKAKYDPLTNEIREVEQRVQYMADNPVIRTDSVTIIHTIKRIYGTENVTSVFFDKATSQLDMEAQVDLATVALAMVKNPSWKADIFGFTDKPGDADLSMDLSRKRCEMVMAFFVDELGLDRERFVLYPKGDTELLFPHRDSSSDDLGSINRRVDVVLIK